MQSKISIAFRTRLTRYIHDLYLNATLAYYKVIHLDGEIVGIDQYITTDVARFCDTAASLFSHLGKPTIDMVVFNYQLMQTLGLVPMLLILANFAGTTWLLRRVSPAFGRLAAREARLEGDFRNAHARLITNAEEIAFYKGERLEKKLLDGAFMRLLRHVDGVLKIRIAYNMFEDFTIKYAWSAFGLILCSVPTFLPFLGSVAGLAGSASPDGDASERVRTGNFVTNKRHVLELWSTKTNFNRFMLSLADAGGRIMYSYKDIAELAGYTSRVFTLLSTLHRVHSNSYAPPPDRKFPDEFSLADVRGTCQEGCVSLSALVKLISQLRRGTAGRSSDCCTGSSQPDRRTLG